MSLKLAQFVLLNVLKLDSSLLASLPLLSLWWEGLTHMEMRWGKESRMHNLRRQASVCVQPWVWLSPTGTRTAAHGFNPHQAAVFIFLSLTSCQTVCITGVVATPGPFIKIFLVVTWLCPSSQLTARSSLTPKQHRSCARPLSNSYSSFFPLLAPALPAQDSNMVCFWGMPAFSSKTSK